MNRQRWWLCFPPFVMCVIDHAVTARNQTPHYWEGHYHLVNEANPVVNWAMRQHTLGLHAITLAWIALFCALIRWLPHRLALFAAVAIAFSHGFMAGTWFYLKNPDGYYWALGLCLFTAFLIAQCLPGGSDTKQSVDR